MRQVVEMEMACADSRFKASEFFGQSSLLQYSIRGMPGLDFAIDYKMDLSDRAAPDLVITLAISNKQTICSQQQPL